jgi:hypothetical protein
MAGAHHYTNDRDVRICREPSVDRLIGSARADESVLPEDPIVVPAMALDVECGLVQRLDWNRRHHAPFQQTDAASAKSEASRRVAARTRAMPAHKCASARARGSLLLPRRRLRLG